MTEFPTILLGLSLAAAALVLSPLLVWRRAAATGASRDVELYRDQMKELEAERARETLSPAEADGARAEIARRLLLAAERAQQGGALTPAPRAWSLAAALAIAFTLPGLAIGLYAGPEAVGLGLVPGTGLGRPDLPDRPLAARSPDDLRIARFRVIYGALPAQAAAEAARPPHPAGTPTPDEAAWLDQIARTEREIQAAPDEIAPRIRLAVLLQTAGRADLAWRAIDALIRTAGPQARPRWYEEKAMEMIEAAGFTLTAEAALAVHDGLRLNPKSVRLRYYLGVLMTGTERPERALGVWQALRRDAVATAPWILPDLDRAITGLTQSLVSRGVIAPPVAPGPDPDQIAEAAAMSPAEQREMIETMVAGLETRLLAEGGPRESWLRLVTAYRVLGRIPDARRIRDLARERLPAAEAGWLDAQIGEIDATTMPAAGGGGAAAAHPPMTRSMPAPHP